MSHKPQYRHNHIPNHYTGKSVCSLPHSKRLIYPLETQAVPLFGQSKGEKAPEAPLSFLSIEKKLNIFV